MFTTSPGKKEQKGHGPVNIKIFMMLAPITVPPAETLFSKAIQSLTVAAAGPVFMSPSAKEASFTLLIIHMVWLGLKCNVAAANRTSGMCLTTARHPPVYVIASMGWCLIFSKQKKLKKNITVKKRTLNKTLFMCNSLPRREFFMVYIMKGKGSNFNNAIFA